MHKPNTCFEALLIVTSLSFSIRRAAKKQKRSLSRSQMGIDWLEPMMRDNRINVGINTQDYKLFPSFSSMVVAIQQEGFTLAHRAFD